MVALYFKKVWLYCVIPLNLLLSIHKFQFLIAKTRHIIVGIIDFFYQPFAKIIPIQTFRYLACGGSNTLFGIYLDYIAFTFIFQKRPFPVFGIFSISPEVGAWVIAFSISFPAGFALSRYIVFPESNLHSRIQLFRYLLTTVGFTLLNYIMIKEFTLWFPFIHQTIRYSFICFFLAILSYMLQRKYTFKTVPAALS